MAEPSKTEHENTEHEDQDDIVPEDNPMPYRWPRGYVTGSRRGLRIIQVASIALIFALFAMLAYMSRVRWGR